MAGYIRRCVICGNECTIRLLTCSDECHKKLVNWLVREFGEYKIIVDVHTGLRHKVPTRDILEKGLKYDDLKKYPVVEG